MAYQSNLMGDFWRTYRQRRVGAGNALSQNEIGGLLNPMLESNATMARDAGLRQKQQEQFDRSISLQERARKDQQVAGIVGGVGQLAMLPMAYSSAKNLGWIGNGLSNKDLMARSIQTQTMNDATRNATSTGATTAQGTVAPSVAATTAQGGTAAATPMTQAEMGSLTSDFATSGAGEVGLLGTASSVAAPAAAGAFVGGLLGGPVSKALDTHPKTTKDVMSIGGGAAAGAYAGSSFGPIGTAVGGLVGGAIGAISSLF